MIKQFDTPVARSAARRPGFTLVELLVVIGIIALLISILMPSLNRARQQAQSVQCLSNLKQIGQAFALYTADSRGFIIPGSVQQITGTTLGSGRGDDSWATILCNRGYIKQGDQIALFGNSGSPPGENAWDNPTSVGNTVFHCPAAINQAANPGGATSKIDGNNDGYWRRQSWTFNGGTNAAIQGAGAIVDTFYAGNFVQPGGAQIAAGTGQTLWPMRTLGHNRTTGVIYGGPLTKITQIRQASEMAMLFDGAKAHNLDSNNISARHNGKKTVNFMFADGHAEAVRADQLPNGKDSPASPSNTSDFDSIKTTDANTLAKHPFPHWRLDQ